MHSPPCKSAQGRVINVPKPGKSNALNAGLEATQTEFLVRVDADTLVGEDNLSRAMPYFSDPAVGVVGGVPIPPGGALFDRARLLEVIVKHGFYSVAMGAVNGVVGIPGMFVVYRTEHPKYLGGFVEGMNGEDTDISLRIGELGYHSVVDPKLRYVSEVPASYLHMREQRMRWFSFNLSYQLALSRFSVFAQHDIARQNYTSLHANQFRPPRHVGSFDFIWNDGICAWLQPK